MDYKQTLIKMIDRFNLEAVEEFKDIELQIYADSRRIFKKNKDYDGMIGRLRKCKKNAQKLDPRSIKIPEDDKLTKELMTHFQRCIVIFSGLCDAYIQFETALRNKAEGTDDKVKYSDIKVIKDKLRTGKTTLNDQLNEVNIRYAEYNDMQRTEEEKEDLKGLNYMTYEDLMKGSDD
ncbi:MAG: hypothetical protein IJI74_00565 [Firmicutes bacterium]|nr:hypothetical protein [Bacillota bacterium]